MAQLTVGLETDGAHGRDPDAAAEVVRELVQLGGKSELRITAIKVELRRILVTLMAPEIPVHADYLAYREVAADRLRQAVQRGLDRAKAASDVRVVA